MAIASKSMNFICSLEEGLKTMRLLIVKRCLAGLLCFIFFVALGCTSESLISSEKGPMALSLVDVRAKKDMACSSVVLDRPVRRDLIEEWPHSLFSEYVIWATGCGKEATYRVRCGENMDCVLVD